MQDERAAGHVAMGRQADVVVVAPATAHVLARLAHGFSDDLVATTVLATSAPVIVAPAMETHMWQNAATQANVAALRARGVRVIDPETGPLASGHIGPGRLAPLERIEAAIERATKKMKKKELGNEMRLRLVENPDLLSAIVATRRPGTIVIGFKAETGDATAEAGRMLRDKKLDLVVANDVADPRSAFGSDD